MTDGRKNNRFHQTDAQLLAASRRGKSKSPWFNKPFCVSTRAKRIFAQNEKQGREIP